MGYAFLPPAVVKEAAVILLQKPLLGIYPSCCWIAVSLQEERAPLWEQGTYSYEESPEILQTTVLLGHIRNLSQEEVAAIGG